MLNVNRWAIKEWRVVVEALAQGKQTVLVRKGGIAESGGTFRVEQNEFWFFPTYVHQSVDALTPVGRELLTDDRRSPDPMGIPIQYYAVVDEIFFVERESGLTALADRQILSLATLTERFRYRKAGLFVLTLRVYSRPMPQWLVESPHFAGCRSWVDLPADLPTGDLRPVLSDAAYANATAEIRAALRPAGLA